jgi:peptidyl-prolyl cis-trans isomerase B (cyclophilin B)
VVTCHAPRVSKGTGGAAPVANRIARTYRDNPIDWPLGRSDSEARDPSVVTKRQRERQLARQKWERQQERRAQRRSRARKRGIVAGAVVGVLVIGAGGYGVTLLVNDDRQANAAPTSSPEPAPSATPTPAAAPRPTTAGECSFVAQGGPDQKPVGVPEPEAPVKDAVATIRTSRGTITADLLGTQASCAVHSFTYLAGKDAFDKTVCTGLAAKPAPARYLECGDLTGSGASGPGYIFGNENDKPKLGPGWLVMADGENRNGSRFAITYGDTSTFDQPVTVFGKVTAGLDVVKKVARSGLAPGAGTEGVGRPAASVIIEDVKVTTK